MRLQAAAHVLMVRPARFGFNVQTAATNYFQQQAGSLDAAAVQQAALAEFDCMVYNLRENGVAVTLLEDTPFPVKPDAVFPNNWVSFHPDGKLVLYPMCTPNRRLEKRAADLQHLLAQHFAINEVTDLSLHENGLEFLEGTGSIVFDHIHQTAYACISPRTAAYLFHDFCKTMGYRPVSFTALDAGGSAIYHTNVMMCIGTGYAVLCTESIADTAASRMVYQQLRDTGREVVEITLGQMNHFAGNMLEVLNQEGERLLVLSQTALDALVPLQKAVLEKYCRLLPQRIPLIEKIGGGSARCMLAEIFLPLR